MLRRAPISASSADSPGTRRDVERIARSLAICSASVMEASEANRHAGGAGDLDRQPRLADAAGPGERYEAHLEPLEQRERCARRSSSRPNVRVGGSGSACVRARGSVREDQPARGHAAQARTPAPARGERSPGSPGRRRAHRCAGRRGRGRASAGRAGVRGRGYSAASASSSPARPSVVAVVERGLDAILDRRGPQIVEPADLGLQRRCVVAQVGQRRGRARAIGRGGPRARRAPRAAGSRRLRSPGDRRPGRARARRRDTATCSALAAVGGASSPRAPGSARRRPPIRYGRISRTASSARCRGPPRSTGTPSLRTSRGPRMPNSSKTPASHRRPVRCARARRPEDPRGSHRAAALGTDAPVSGRAAAGAAAGSREREAGGAEGDQDDRRDDVDERRRVVVGDDGRVELRPGSVPRKAAAPRRAVPRLSGFRRSWRGTARTASGRASGPRRSWLGRTSCRRGRRPDALVGQRPGARHGGGDGQHEQGDGDDAGGGGGHGRQRPRRRLTVRCQLR